MRQRSSRLDRGENHPQAGHGPWLTGVTKEARRSHGKAARS
jgi:hypothetical protein